MCATLITPHDHTGWHGARIGIWHPQREPDVRITYHRAEDDMTKTPTQHLISFSFSVIEAWRDGKASEELAREAFQLVCNFGEGQDVDNVCSLVALKLLGTNEVHLVEGGEIAVAHDFSGALDCTVEWPTPFDVADLSEAAIAQVKESVRLRDPFQRW